MRLSLSVPTGLSSKIKNQNEKGKKERARTGEVPAACGGRGGQIIGNPNSSLAYCFFLTSNLISNNRKGMCDFKSKLFGYAHSHGCDGPNYTFQNEGFPHCPCFRVTLHVAGHPHHTFTAPKTFKRRKDAEQFVSQLAFQTLSQQAPPNAFPFSTSFLRVPCPYSYPIMNVRYS